MRRAQLLRAVTVLVLGAALLMVFNLLRTGSEGPKEPEVAEAIGDARSVAAVIGEEQSQKVAAVRGFLFDGGGTGMRLCHRRQPGKAPVCLGPFLDVYGLDAKQLPFRSGEALGRPIKWVEDPVTVYGHVLGTRIDVTDVAR